MGHVQLYDGYDDDAFQLSGDLSTATRIEFYSSAGENIYWGNGYGLGLHGSGLIWDFSAGDRPIAGVVDYVDVFGSYGHEVVSGVNVQATTLGLVFGPGGPPILSPSALGVGGDLIEVMGTSSPSTDTTFLARGWGGNDTMLGGGSQCSLFGGDGDDSISARSGDGNYLRGDAGDDAIVGAGGFDDINGNQGNDTLHGGDGGDWVVGGKDDDLQFGEGGSDVVWGNLGNDTLDGGDSADQVRGGQGDDSVSGGAGDDYVSGDRGNDTISGGAGADLFHTFSGAGLDRVLDFHLSEGDRVMLDPGTPYSVSQVGPDTVVDMGGGSQMILVGVQMSTLTPGWIFEG